LSFSEGEFGDAVSIEPYLALVVIEDVDSGYSGFVVRKPAGMKWMRLTTDVQDTEVADLLHSDEP
jgi:hypothetical protein